MTYAEIKALSSYAYQHWKQENPDEDPLSEKLVLDIIESPEFEYWSNQNPKGTIEQFMANRKKNVSPSQKVQSLYKEVNSLNERISSIQVERDKLKEEIQYQHNIIFAQSIYSGASIIAIIILAVLFYRLRKKAKK